MRGSWWPVLIQGYAFHLFLKADDLGNIRGPIDQNPAEEPYPRGGGLHNSSPYVSPLYP